MGGGGGGGPFPTCTIIFSKIFACVDNFFLLIPCSKAIDGRRKYEGNRRTRAEEGRKLFTLGLGQ